MSEGLVDHTRHKTPPIKPLESHANNTNVWSKGAVLYTDNTLHVESKRELNTAV